MSASPIVPLFKAQKDFFHDAEMLANETTGMKPGDKLSWKVHRDGSFSPVIFSAKQGAFFQNASKKLFSADDGRTASIRAIQWSLGYVASGNRRPGNNSLTYQDRLTQIFDNLALTYDNSQKQDSQIAAQNYRDAARIIREELREFPPKTEVIESESEEESSDEASFSSPESSQIEKEEKTQLPQTGMNDLLSRIEPPLIDLGDSPLQPLAIQRASSPLTTREQQIKEMKRIIAGLFLLQNK